VASARNGPAGRSSPRNRGEIQETRKYERFNGFMEILEEKYKQNATA
jgi:hypothetical protein